VSGPTYFRTRGARVRLERDPASEARRLHLAWPGEGEAAVAVEGLGSLGTSGGGEPVPIASLAKVMTAYLVLEDHPLEPGGEGFRIRIGAGDVEEMHQRASAGQSVVAVEAGEVLSERQALEALLLPSANNVAALLAVHEAGSVEAFVAEMNEAAAELGMRRTRYTDPSGFEDTTVSTAADQLKIGRAAMADPTFAEIVALPSTRTVLGAVLGQRQGDLVAAALASARSLAASVASELRLSRPQ
jgi:serine-type D-Ala-D-Ala carboxypeptidase (penicillin-binding protein 5/6)